MACAAPELTLQDYDDAILFFAEAVVAHGERFVPFLDKMIAGRERLERRQDLIARARAILQKNSTRHVIAELSS